MLGYVKDKDIGARCLGRDYKRVLGHVTRAIHFTFVRDLDLYFNFAVFTPESTDFPSFVFIFFGVNFGIGQGEVDIGLN